MTAPQFPAGWGQAPAPAPQPPAQYPNPAYAPQFPPGQLPPQQYAPPAPAYAPPMQAYAQPQYAPPEQFTPAGGTLDGYLAQRSAGAAYWKFPQEGHVNIGMVARDLRDSDVAQVTFKGQPIRRQDGSISQEKALTIPLVNADGSEAVWEVKGKNRDVLTAAVQAAGVASGVPEGGGMLRVQFVRREQVPNSSAVRNVLDVQYARPQGAAPAQAPAPADPWASQAPAPQAAPAAPVAQAPVPQPQAPPVQSVPAPVAAPGLSPEAAAQFQNMLGGAQQ